MIISDEDLKQRKFDDYLRSLVLYGLSGTNKAKKFVRKH